MSFGGDVYAFALQALEGSLSSTTSKTDRQSYDTFIQQLKESQECLPVITSILGKDCGEFVKLLAITILNDWIKLWWNKILESDQFSVRKLAFDILSSPLGSSQNKSIRTKIAVIITNLAQRQFPQYWPNFVEEFVSIWSNPSTSPELQEVIIMSFEFLIVDCIDSDFNNTLPTLRRQEIVSGIKEKQELLLQTSFQCLTANLNVYCSVQQGSPEAAQSKSLIIAIIKLLISLAYLIKTEEICTPAHNFADLLLKMLVLPQIQEHTIELLQVLCGHALSLELLTTLLIGFQRLGFLPLTSLPTELQERITFQRNYAVTLVSILAHNMSTVFDTMFLSDAQAVACIVDYMNILMQFLKLSSRKLAADVIKDFIKIFREDLVSNMPEMSNFAMSILSEYMLKCKKPLWLELPNNKALEPDEVFELEFEDDNEEWHEFYGMFKSQIKLLAETITARYPILTMVTLTNYLKSLLTTEQQLTPPVNAEKVDENVDYKSLLLDFDIFYTIYMPLFTYILPRDTELTSGELQHQTQLPAVKQAIDFTQVQSCMIDIITVILAWQPKTVSCVLEKFKLLQSHSGVLKLFPVEHVIQVYSVYFSAFSPSNPLLASATTASAGTLRMKAATHIATLTVTVAENIVKSQFLESFLTEINTILTTTPEKGLQTSMRETLICLSEYVPDNELKTKILNIALVDVIQKLCVQSDDHCFVAVYSTPETLLTRAYEHASSVDSHVMTDIRNTINTVYLTAKRVKNPVLPLEVYTQRTEISLEQFRSVFPFADVWISFLPSLFHGVKTLHELWQPGMRQLIATQGTPQMTDLHNALYALQPVDIMKICNKNANIHTIPQRLVNSVSYKIHSEIREVRIFMYQVLAQAAVHKVVYLLPEFTVFLSELTTYFETMENGQLLLLLKYFIEPFILHALPQSYAYVSQFLAQFLSSTLTRLTIACDKSLPQSIAQGTSNLKVEFQLYYLCSIAQNSGVSGDEVELVRDSIVNDLSRGYCDFLCKLSSLKGYLTATPTPGSSKQKDTDDNAPSGGGGGKGSEVTVTLSAAEQLENAYKSARTAALHTLTMSPQFAHVTKPYIMSIITMLCLPDSNTCRRCLALVSYLLEESASDARFVSIVAKDAFSAVLMVLLKQEKWSIGMEWEFIEFLLDVYVTLVLGESSAKVQTTAQAATVNDNQQGWNKNPFNKSNVASGGKSNPQSKAGGVGHMVTDVPRQLLLEIPGVTREKIAALDKQLLTLLSKKKRRGIFKDFVTDILVVNGQTSDNGSGDKKGSMFVTAVPKVLDIQRRSMKAKSKKATSTTADNYDLSNLFDDPDL